MLRYWVVESLKIVLRFILYVLGVTNPEFAADDYHQKDVQYTKTNSLKQPDDIISPTLPKHEIRDTGKWNRRNIHICDESSECDTSFRIPRKPLTPKSRRHLQEAMIAPMTSSPMHVLSRQYSSSSGISTASDIVIPGMDSDSSFPEYNDLLDSVFEERDAFETENIQLKAALNILTKEKLQLQDKIIQQHERLLCKKFDAKVGADYAKQSTTPASQLYQTSVRNISMQDSASDICKKRRNDSSDQHCDLNRTVGYCRGKCYGGLSSGRRYLKEHQPSLKEEVWEEAEMMEKIKLLKNENVRLKEYINSLLYLVLENSPSILETNQEHMQDGCP